MPWLSSLGTPVLISEARYFEERDFRGNPDQPQRRERRVTTEEYRGLTQQAAQDALNPSESTTTIVNWHAQRDSEAGSYVAVKITDEAIGSWSPSYIG